MMIYIEPIGALVETMLALSHCLRRWPNIELTLVPCMRFIVSDCRCVAPSQHKALPSVEWMLARAGDIGTALKRIGLVAC